MKTKMLSVMVFILIFIGATYIVFAAPPTGSSSVQQVTSSARTNFNQSPQSVAALAGNVSQLEINVTKQTSYWQGYYGNVSGMITLDNAQNFTMYQWAGMGDVGGNLYASEQGNIIWANVMCANISPSMNKSGCGGVAQTAGECINLSEMLTRYSMSTTDADNINKTFTSTNSITVDTLSLANCPATNLYLNDSSQATRWNETLLTQNNTENLIYAVNLENNIYGFNNNTWDFQMIVGEKRDGALTTTYYFYIELQ
jgi:hypothetical protein